MDIGIPNVHAEVATAFARCEAAIIANDGPTLNALFHRAPATIRYGMAENLHGFEEIAACRGDRSFEDVMRPPACTVITTHGHDPAVASTPFHRSAAPGKLGRQMQTWMRFPEDWQIVAAHVSLIDEP